MNKLMDEAAECIPLEQERAKLKAYLECGCNGVGLVLPKASAADISKMMGTTKESARPLIDAAKEAEGPDHSKLPYLTPEEYMKSVEAAFRGYYRSFNSDWQGHSSYYEKNHVADLGSALEFANRIACEAILGLPR